MIRAAHAMAVVGAAWVGTMMPWMAGVVLAMVAGSVMCGAAAMEVRNGRS